MNKNNEIEKFVEDLKLNYYYKSIFVNKKPSNFINFKWCK